MDLGGRPCPCGSPSYDACCGRLHRGEAQAGTPEELMRSRYSAYAIGDADHVWRTWHPRSRPAEVTIHPGTQWTGLEVLEAAGDVVEFRAHHRTDGEAGVLHERSRFERRAGRWFYVESV
jgi:SEC-C motif-containing protein